MLKKVRNKVNFQFHSKLCVMSRANLTIRMSKNSSTVHLIPQCSSGFLTSHSFYVLYLIYLKLYICGEIA